jgi:hypothetical protein
MWKSCGIKGARPLGAPPCGYALAQRIKTNISRYLHVVEIYGKKDPVECIWLIKAISF